MPGKAARCFRLCSLACFLFLVHASPAPAAERSLTVPFEFSASRDAILLHVQINNRPALLIFDTGAAHTVLRPQAAGVDPKELAPTQPGSGDGGFVRDAIGREVTLEVGSMKWQKRRVAVMDLSQVLSAYREKIDGILGFDFLSEFREVKINLRDKTVVFSGDASEFDHVVLQTSHNPALSFGNLRNLALDQVDHGYTLNGVALPKVSSDSVFLSSSDMAYRVRASFLKTVRAFPATPMDKEDLPLLDNWAKTIPLVGRTLNTHDAIFSVKIVAYDLLSPPARQDLQFQEEVVVLWNANPDGPSRSGDISLYPPVPFLNQLVDVQYRGLPRAADRLFGKIVLQILYIRDHEEHFLLGGFVIVSKANGDFEFYLIPRPVLDQIVVGAK